MMAGVATREKKTISVLSMKGEESPPICIVTLASKKEKQVKRVLLQAIKAFTDRQCWVEKKSRDSQTRLEQKKASGETSVESWPKAIV